MENEKGKQESGYLKWLLEQSGSMGFIPVISIKKHKKPIQEAIEAVNLLRNSQ